LHSCTSHQAQNFIGPSSLFYSEIQRLQRPRASTLQPLILSSSSRSAIQRLQKASDRFWVLEYLRRNPGPWEAILIPVFRRNLREGSSLCTMHIPVLGLVQSVPSPSTMPPEGHPVMATVVSVSPHRGEVLFKITI
jgi:hypothetical protein